MLQINHPFFIRPFHANEDDKVILDKEMSYINAILNCLQNRKYCEAIMDDLLLFTPTKASHSEKLEELLKALCKNGLKISPKKCQLFKMIFNIWVTQYLSETKEYVLDH